MRLVLAFAAAAALFTAQPARAEVASASPGAFEIRAEAEIPASPAQTWRALTHVERWWNSTHTYSGDAGRLRLDPQAGGCWCERWGEGQSVEHARVVAVTAHEGARTLRAIGALGPLQAMGATGVLTFTLSPLPSGTKITMNYRVLGESGSALDQIAPTVDGVMMEQFGRLIRYTVSGAPE